MAPPELSLPSILDQADTAFAEQDRLLAELRKANETINHLCQSYSKATGCFGLRPEALRRVINDRRATNAA